MYIVGVDIAKRNHEAMVMDPNGNTRRKPFSFSNSESGFQSLLEVLDSVSHKPSDFVIAMESTAHYWYALHDFLVGKGYSVTVLNSLQSSSFRSMDIRPVKTDAKDSALIADVIRFDRYSKSQTPASQVRTLREMCRQIFYFGHGGRRQKEGYRSAGSGLSGVRDNFLKYCRTNLHSPAAPRSHAGGDSVSQRRGAFPDHLCPQQKTIQDGQGSVH